MLRSLNEGSCHLESISAAPDFGKLSRNLCLGIPRRQTPKSPKFCAPRSLTQLKPQAFGGSPCLPALEWGAPFYKSRSREHSGRVKARMVRFGRVQVEVANILCSGDDTAHDEHVCKLVSFVGVSFESCVMSVDVVSLWSCQREASKLSFEAIRDPRMKSLGWIGKPEPWGEILQTFQGPGEDLTGFHSHRNPNRHYIILKLPF